MDSHWLVRTSTNVISGPYAREELIALIRAQRIGLQDEICISDGMWFGLHENNEIAQQLGVTPDELHLTARRERLSGEGLEDDDDVTKVVQPPVRAQVAPEETRVTPALGTSNAVFSPSEIAHHEIGQIGRHEIGHPATLPSQTDGDTVVARRLARAQAPGSVRWIVKEKVWRAVTTGLLFIGFFVLFVILKKLRS